MMREIGAMSPKDRPEALQNGTNFNATSQNSVALPSGRRLDPTYSP
jgi:hypothetical protein